MSLPSNYKRIEYLQSNGSQHIKLPFTIDNATNVEIKSKILSNGGQFPFDFLYFDEYANRTAKAYYLLKNIFTYASNIEYDIDYLIKSNGYEITINGTKYTGTGNAPTKNANYYLFAYCDFVTSYRWLGRIYNYTLYKNGSLICDCVPAERNDNVLGMYDLANNAFYTNNGSGTFTKGPYLVNISGNANPSGSGNIIGLGYYNIGDQVSLLAQANSGWEFENWLLKGYTHAGTGTFTYGHELTENIYFEDNPLNFIANEDIEVQANFKVRYNITINYDSTLGTASYMWGVGNQIILTATPNANAQFLGWYKDTTLVSTELETTYNVYEDTTLEARFERIYNINSSVVGSGSISYNRQASDKNQVEFYVIPSEHYHFVKYVLDGVDYTTTPLNVRLQNDCTIVAYFEEDSKYNVNVSANIDQTSVYVSDTYVYYGTSVNLWARPFPNYVFEKWSDGNYENPRTIVVEEETTLIAEYKHIIETNGIYQYRCFVKDQLDLEAPPKAFMVVDTFDLKQDYLTNANSTINVLQMADNVNNGDVIVVYNPKGEVIYNGVITAISDLKISTSQMQSFYKGTWIYNTHPSTYIEEEIAYLLDQYAQGKMYGSTYTDNLVAQRLGGITIQHIDAISGALPTDLDDNGNPKYTTKDMEKWIYELYANYGIVFEFTINMVGTNYVEIKVPTYSSISIGNNHYAIDNLTPMQTIEETNRLIIYAQNKTYRTTYVATTNGIVEQPVSTANRFNITNTKVVFSDDDVSDLVEANLPTQTINHKISFDLLLKNNLYEFKDFKLGMPIEIYYNGTDYYNSVITARKLKKDTNQNVSVVSYTCGNVRTTITQKLTLGKAQGGYVR